MTLSDAGEARVRGYLFILERSLRSFMPGDAALDAVREVESHIREQVEQTDPREERSAVERVLAQLGPPLRVAQAYCAEMTLEEAVTTGRFVPMLRAVSHAATTSVFGFAWAMLVLIGWSTGIVLVALAMLKPILPGNVGLFVVNGRFHGVGMEFGLPPGTEVRGGYWVIPLALVAGLAVLVGTHRASRRILAWLRARTPPPRVRLRLEVRGSSHL